jgi:hypothetical protein
MYHVDRSTSLPMPIVDSLFLRCSQSIVFMLVLFGSGFLAARPRAIGRALRSKHDQVSKHSSRRAQRAEPSSGLRATRVAISVIIYSRPGPSVGPQQFGNFLFYTSVAAPAINYFSC